jgi:hypothetical protein
MKFAKRLLMVAGAVALAGLFGVMLAPKAVHAVVSTLVTVANNVSVVNPVNGSGQPTPLITVNGAALSSFGTPFTCTFPAGSNHCTYTVGPVPANDIAVIQSFSGLCNLDTGTSLVGVLATGGSPTPSTAFFVVPGAPVNDTVVGQTIQSFGQNITAYVLGGSSGTPINVLIASNVPQASSADGCSFVLSGYVVQQ